MNINENLKTEYNWYIIQSYAGHEKKVASQIEQRAKAGGLEDDIEEVLVPTQEKIQVSEGKKRKKQEKILPGYVLVKMRLNESTYRVVRNAEGSKGFVGAQPGQSPTPMPDAQVKSIIALTQVEEPAYSASFSVGDPVKVGAGAFKDFVGTIDEINEDKGQVKVMLSIFGRETPVTLDFDQVNKL